MPLCARLGFDPLTPYGVGDEAAPVAELAGRSGVVLVCWEHKKIVESIVPLLADNQPIPALPAKWKRDRFDVALRFDRTAPGAPWQFRKLFPKLLSGDSDRPVEQCHDEAAL